MANIIQKVAHHCTKRLNHPRCKALPFHNLLHTQEVIQNVKQITAAMDINARDTQLVLVAAWFHDTGFSKTYNGHEEVSIEYATKFLTKLEVDNRTIQQICNCIEATKVPQSPTTQLAEILCDADIFHISNLHFYYRKLLLRREWEVFCDIKMTDKEWHLLNLEFLENCHFYTPYGKNILKKGKEMNINLVKQIISYF